MPAEQREKKPESDYHLQMTEELRRDVGGLCNYSDAMLMLGRKEGMAEGMEKGMAKGRAEGEFAMLVSLVRKNLLEDRGGRIFCLLPDDYKVVNDYLLILPGLIAPGVYFAFSRDLRHWYPGIRR